MVRVFRLANVNVAFPHNHHPKAPSKNTTAPQSSLPREAVFLDLLKDNTLKSEAKEVISKCWNSSTNVDKNGTFTNTQICRCFVEYESHLDEFWGALIVRHTQIGRDLSTPGKQKLTGSHGGT